MAKASKKVSVSTFQPSPHSTSAATLANGTRSSDSTPGSREDSSAAKPSMAWSTQQPFQSKTAATTRKFELNYLLEESIY